MRPLQTYDAWLLDLDGVVYRGAHAVPGAVAGLNSANEHGISLVYVTNNAARPPEDVRAHLLELGAPVEAGMVLTSAQAGAHLLGARLGDPAVLQGWVLAIGGPGVCLALQEAGFPCRSAADVAGNATHVGMSEALSGVAAVLQGYGPDVSWRHLALGAYAVQRGALWVATNTDRTIPRDGGIAPGNGTLVDAISEATGVVPPAAGKPFEPIMRQAVELAGASAPLVVGDRLDTDIAGAAAIGAASALVLTGVSGLMDVWSVPPSLRPRHVVPALDDLCGDVPDLWAASPEAVGQEAGFAHDRGGDLLARIAVATMEMWQAMDGTGQLPPGAESQAGLLQVLLEQEINARKA